MYKLCNKSVSSCIFDCQLYLKFKLKSINPSYMDSLLKLIAEFSIMAKCALPEEADMEPHTEHRDTNIFICTYVYICVYTCISVHMNMSLYLLNVAPAAA